MGITKLGSKKVSHQEIARLTNIIRLLARKTAFKIGWIKAHAKDNKPDTNWKRRVELTRIRDIKIEDSSNEEWYGLGEWLHQK